MRRHSEQRESSQVSPINVRKVTRKGGHERPRPFPATTASPVLMPFPFCPPLWGEEAWPSFSRPIPEASNPPCPPPGRSFIPDPLLHAPLPPVSALGNTLGCLPLKNHHQLLQVALPAHSSPTSPPTRSPLSQSGPRSGVGSSTRSAPRSLPVPRHLRRSSPLVLFQSPWCQKSLQAQTRPGWPSSRAATPRLQRWPPAFLSFSSGFGTLFPKPGY